MVYCTPRPHGLFAHRFKCAVDVRVADADSALQLDDLSEEAFGLKTDSDGGRPLEVAALRLDDQFEHPAEKRVLEVVSAEVPDELVEFFRLFGEFARDASVDVHLSVFRQLHYPGRSVVGAGGRTALL